MPGKRLNRAQSEKLSQLEAVHGEVIQARAFARAEIEQAYRTKMLSLDVRESTLMNEAKLAGVPKSQIARAVGTQNWTALEAKYALTAEQFVNVVAQAEWEILPVHKVDGQYAQGFVRVASWDDGGEIVSMEGDLLYIVYTNPNDDSEQIMWGTPYPAPLQALYESVMADDTRGPYFLAELEKIRQAIVSERAND